MKILQFSDLHVEFMSPKAQHEIGHKILNSVRDNEVDVVVANGDIGTGTSGIYFLMNLLHQEDIDMIYVPGNHEFYGQDYDILRTELEDICRDETKESIAYFHLLDDDAVTIKGVRFIGSTLWTDMALNGNPVVAACNAAMTMNDYNRILRDTRPEIMRGAVPIVLSPKDTLDAYKMARFFITSELMEHENCVVVTHHCPSVKCINTERYSFRDADPYYASNMHDLLWDSENHPKVWFCGHTHRTMDEMVGETRVVMNCHGYLDHEDNSKFKFDNIIEV